MMAYFWENPIIQIPASRKEGSAFSYKSILELSISDYSGSKPSIKVNRDAPFNPVWPGWSLIEPDAVIKSK
jgi:hypothetical protein